MLGNPHSVNPASALSGSLIERCRAHILSFFNASADEYAVVFTANASHALKLVGEAYPFEPGDQLLMHVTLERSKAGIFKFRGVARVGDEVACEAELMCTMRRIASEGAA